MVVFESEMSSVYIKVYDIMNDVPRAAAVLVLSLSLSSFPDRVEEFNELISHWQLAEGESQEEMSWKISADDMKTHKDKVSAQIFIWMRKCSRGSR